MTAAAAAGWHAEELVYCANVHPGNDLRAVTRALYDFIVPVARRRRVGWAGAGLWLNGTVADGLCKKEALAQFQVALRDAGVHLFTLNGFPYGDFHTDSVKAQVYLPDWAEPIRKTYTLQLAEILAACLPTEVAEGTISTLPLGYRPTWSPAKQDAALRQLCEVAEHLAELKARTGRSIRVCLEMEPGCILESTTEVVELFESLLPTAAARDGIAIDCIHAHLGICFDVCHQAVMFEDAYRSLATLRDAGIVIGKIQISSALEVAHPIDPDIGRLLGQFAEPKYLHQVRCRDDEDRLHGVMDLPEALHGEFPRHHPWRIHFHVPVQTQQLFTGELGTTQWAIEEVLDFLRDHSATIHPHLEVETYTWGVLPESLRPDSDAGLIGGLKAELQWLQDQLAARGLLRT